MAVSSAVVPLFQRRALEGATTDFNSLGIYRFCIAVAALDVLDIYEFAESTNIVKYAYAAVAFGFMAAYFLRWRKIDPSAGPIIFLFFFFLTGLVFMFRFFIFEERNSYISAFISPLIYSLAIFIPPNTVTVDARKILRDLLILFALGSLAYVGAAVLKPVWVISSGLNDVQLVKTMSCLLALCLCILTGRKVLALIFILISLIALELRPASTFVLGLICCVPIAVTLRSRVVAPRPMPIFIARALAMSTLILAVCIPLLLYFFFDDISSLIADAEQYLKSDIIGGQSNMGFRLAILKLAFAEMDKASFWYGNALSGSLTVPLGQNLAWQWWYTQNSAGEATIHSDFVLVLSLMGILGYVVFSSAFYLVLRARFQTLAHRSVVGGSAVLQAISIVGCVALVIYFSDQPYLSFYSHTHLVWMLLLFSEVARKSKVIG